MKITMVPFGLSRKSIKKGEEVMKKVLFVVLFVVAALVLVSGQSYAAVCSSCHTMHNSQNGTAVDPAGPNPVLLIGSCLGCHAQVTASNVVTGIPQVRHTNATDLAAGNFTDVNTADANGHNVLGLKAQDGALALTPPGGTGAMASLLTCAGTLGCHGNRTNANQMTDISGSHHNNNAVAATTAGYADATDANPQIALGQSYRFLSGVQGWEAAAWTNTDATHNELYSGGASGISTFCSNCHATFHETVGSTGNWLRHPVSYALTAPVAANYTAVYSAATPIARALATDLSTGPLTTAGVSDQVMCLSCHVAHGSPYTDAMRFDYSLVGTGGAGGTAGCNKCHNK